MKAPTELVTHGQQPTHRRIFEELRGQIQSGRYTPGTQLPGTRELAVNWQTSIFTVHTALRALAKEGWIDRRPNAGTYIADPRSRFLCAGIYYGSDTGSVRNTPFGCFLHFALLDRLQALGKTIQVFNDPRPANEQGELFPPLAEAIAQKRIQCLISPDVNRGAAELLARLALPTAFLANPFAKSRVSFDADQFLRSSVAQLASKGCRSVGILSHVFQPTEEDVGFHHFHASFQRAIEKEGLSTRDEWIRHPHAPPSEPDAYGYHEFKKLWSLAEKPDGLIVFPDTLAGGAIIAILELGLGIVPSRMKFVFQRNAHHSPLCPFPATWAVSDENRLAAALVELIEKQFAGEAIHPGHLDYEFSHGCSIPLPPR